MVAVSNKRTALPPGSALFIGNAETDAREAGGAAPARASSAELLVLLRRIADGIDELRHLARSAAVSSSTAKTAVTVAEAAHLLGCSRTRVFGLLRKGTLKRAPRSGRSTLVTQESIQTALATPEPAARPLRHRRSTGGTWKPVDRRRLGV